MLGEQRVKLLLYQSEAGQQVFSLTGFFRGVDGPVDIVDNRS